MDVDLGKCIPQDYLATRGQWVRRCVGKYFSYKNMAADEDHAFVSQHYSS